MPEVDFILAPDEQMGLIEYLLNRGLKFVPDIHYDEPAYATLDSMQEILRYAEPPTGTRLFFVLSPTFSPHPLGMRALPSAPQRPNQCFYVVQRRGGPYLDLLVSVLRHVPAPLLVSGFSAFYPSYWIGSPEVEVPAPSELKALHKSVLAWLRDHGRCVVTANARRRYWMGAAAEDAISHGVRCNVQNLLL